MTMSLTLNERVGGAPFSRPAESVIFRGSAPLGAAPFARPAESGSFEAFRLLEVPHSLVQRRV